MARALEDSAANLQRTANRVILFACLFLVQGILLSFFIFERRTFSHTELTTVPCIVAAMGQSVSLSVCQRLDLTLLFLHLGGGSLYAVLAGLELTL